LKGGAVAELRFCLYQYQHLPLSELRLRWLRAEALGFDVLWNVDTVVEPDTPGAMMFDGPSTLVQMALATSKIRVGTLVSSMYFRSPVTLAKATMTVDHLSNGRVELALGVGDPSAGAAAAGVNWTVREQLARFSEFVELTDMLLRQDRTSYEGRYYRCRDAESVPRPLQAPRPPLTIAAHGPRMLAITSRYADSWSSWGGYGLASEAELFRITRDRSLRLTDLCAELGRDPVALRRSLVCFPPMRPWASTEAFTDMVGRYQSIGINEFVLYWPRTWDSRASEEATVFERVMSDVAPGLKAGPR
jgi:alkanesulfonate monooxygenase SsuD/methylene tetrahydromethanopterin reductase-like flavin-dependent oxidoreductase (luciferase family)